MFIRSPKRRETVRLKNQSLLQEQGRNTLPPEEVMFTQMYRAFRSRGGAVCGEFYPEADLFVPRRVCRSRGEPVGSEAGLSCPRWSCLSRAGPISPEAVLLVPGSIPRRAYRSRGGPVYLEVYPEAGLSVLRRAYLTLFLRCPRVERLTIQPPCVCTMAANHGPCKMRPTCMHPRRGSF